MLIVKTSLIQEAGNGCFSSTKIEAGSRLSPGVSDCRYLELDEIPRQYLKYCVLMKSGRFLSPKDFSNMGPLWYINHAKHPNVEFRQGKLHAKIDIAAGTELTLYYSDLLTHPMNFWVKPEDI